MNEWVWRCVVSLSQPWGLSPGKARMTRILTLIYSQRRSLISVHFIRVPRQLLFINLQIFAEILYYCIKYDVHVHVSVDQLFLFLLLDDQLFIKKFLEVNKKSFWYHHHLLIRRRRRLRRLLLLPLNLSQNSCWSSSRKLWSKKWAYRALIAALGAARTGGRYGIGSGLGSSKERGVSGSIFFLKTLWEWI